jgi:predicted dithiol-disulfide oxidoreductase (DUF899 family)
MSAARSDLASEPRSLRAEGQQPGYTCCGQRHARDGATSSRSRPPTQEVYQAATAPRSSATAVEKPRIIPLRRALCTAVAGQHYSSRAYSTFARGLDGLWGAYHWLDRAPKGRNDGAGYWWRHHDEYDKR